MIILFLLYQYRSIKKKKKKKKKKKEINKIIYKLIFEELLFMIILRHN